jgi:L-threonylcarbamoyladenylate synthase
MSAGLMSTGVLRTVRLPADKPGFARAMYDALHTLDDTGADAIWLERPPAHEDWRDVNDRLSRAAII